jgi:Flp pilus assembly protein TadD
MIFEMQGQRDEARKQYEAALALDPQAAVAANNLAWSYAEADENLDVALQLAQTAKSRIPDSARISDTLGWLYYKKGLASLAVQSLREATSQSPSDAGMRYRLGLAYLRNGDMDLARGALQQALEPQAEEARKTLASLLG